MGTDNLVDFVKDFHYEYMARAEAHDKDMRAWRTEVLAFDKAREEIIAHKESDVSHMNKKLFEMEVERTRNLGNMTSALLMLALSMDALTRLCLSLQYFQVFFLLGCLDMWSALCIRTR